MTSGNIPLSAEEMSRQLQAQPANSPLTEQEQNAATPYLANSVDDPQSGVSTQINDFLANTKNWLRKFLVVGLVLQGLYGIYKSVYFIFVTYPDLSFLLASHQITQTQVNNYLIHAILMMISTLVSMIFAMRLTIFKTKVAQTFNTLIGIFLVLGNAALHDYFEALHASDFIISMITWFIDFSKSIPVFLERTLG